jgi:hypothetical protein
VLDEGSAQLERSLCYEALPSTQLTLTADRVEVLVR